MIHHSPQGLVAVIEAMDGYTFAAELEERIGNGQMKVVTVSIEGGMYRAVLIPDMRENS